MQLDTVSYLFQGPQGTFKIKERFSGRWRVMHNLMPWGDSFVSPQTAARAVSQTFGVPGELHEWNEIRDVHTDRGGLAFNSD